jgi:hypothetical protein
MPLCALAILSLTLAYAVFNKGAVWTSDWNICLLAKALLTLLYRRRARQEEPPPLDRFS